MKAGNQYYVYIHFHPVTKDVVYVGKGKTHRAWESDRGRQPDHATWIADLLLQGYSPRRLCRNQA
jgi:hypothetical protein